MIGLRLGFKVSSSAAVFADLKFVQHSGHVHVYERTCPVLFKTCLGYDANGHPLAPVHMDIGNGGVSRRK